MVKNNVGIEIIQLNRQWTAKLEYLLTHVCFGNEARSIHFLSAILDLNDSLIWPSITVFKFQTRICVTQLGLTVASLLKQDSFYNRIIESLFVNKDGFFFYVVQLYYK